MPVVAAALVDGAGRVLMQRRRMGAHHGGLWEFPGGKVEAGEGTQAALARELAEELGIAVAPEDCAPLAFAASPAGVPRPIVLLLHRVTRWSGEPRCLDAAAIDWFAPPALLALALPPLDRALLERLARIAGWAVAG